MADPNPDDDRVGYKRPPKKKRWTKGQSGNAGGRRKKQALDSDDRLIALIEAKVPNSEYTVLDLVLKAAIKAALQGGDMKAVRFIYDNYLLAKRRRRSTTTDDDGDRAIVEALLGTDHPLVRDIAGEVAETGADDARTDGPPANDEPDADG